MRVAKSSKGIAAETPQEQSNHPQRITIAEARRRAFDASTKTRQAQIAHSEAESKRSYDYKIEE